MRVRALDENSDWVFGFGAANYISGKDAVYQSVVTRLKSFKNDNPLAMDSNIDWNTLLGQKGTEDTILNEIERVVMQTDGVTRVTRLEVIKTANRIQSLQLSYDTIYDESETVEITDL